VNSTSINAIQARYKASFGEKKMLIDNYRYLALQARLAMQFSLDEQKQELDESLVKLSLLFVEYG